MIHIILLLASSCQTSWRNSIDAALQPKVGPARGFTRLYDTELPTIFDRHHATPLGVPTHCASDQSFNKTRSGVLEMRSTCRRFSDAVQSSMHHAAFKEPRTWSGRCFRSQKLSMLLKSNSWLCNRRIRLYHSNETALLKCPACWSNGWAPRSQSQCLLSARRLI